VSQPWAYCEHCGTIEPPEKRIIIGTRSQIETDGERLALELQETSQRVEYYCSDCGAKVDYDDS